jgi:hypothetical protein
MAFCTNCGAPVETGKFCPKCGTPVKQPDGTSAVDQSNVTSPTAAPPVAPPGQAGTAPPPGMPVPPRAAAVNERSNPDSKVAVIAGALGAFVMLLGVIGSVLPWATVSVMGFKASSGGLHGDGVITLVTTLFALGFFVIGIINRAKWPFIVTVVLTLITAAVGIYDAVNLSGEASVGIGLILVIIAGLLGLAAGITGIVAPRMHN